MHVIVYLRIDFKRCDCIQIQSIFTYYLKYCQCFLNYMYVIKHGTPKCTLTCVRFKIFKAEHCKS